LPAQGGTEKLSDDEIEATLDRVVELLAYISDKDLFAEFYRKKLSRRLLFEKSASEDHERSILSKLKEQCGAQFTSKVLISPLLLPPSAPSTTTRFLNSLHRFRPPLLLFLLYLSLIGVVIGGGDEIDKDAAFGCVDYDNNVWVRCRWRAW
jgi:hypothetical protein